jgi:2-polyprenyl-3-methyl-5-hydroxy-6-metoxy-1,4-benzoquinol methylase
MPDLLKQWTAPQPRIEQQELLDQGEGTVEEIRQNLRDMHRVNRWLGGHAALRRFLLPRMRQAANGRPLRILDVATGAGHTPVTIAQWARRQKIPVTIVALDANPRLLGMALDQLDHYPEIRKLSADARDLPFEPGSFDFVISTQFLHHLNPEGLAVTLKAIARVSRGAVILNDLVRSPAAAFLFRHGAPLFFRNRLTLHDGLASIGQAYTPSEMRKILDDAGLGAARIHNHGVYHRMTVVIEP